MYCRRNQKDWDLIAPFSDYAYSTQYNPSIGATPFFLLYGYEAPLPIDLCLLPEDLNSPLAERSRNEVASKMNEARRMAQDFAHAIALHRDAKQRAHARQPPTFEPGSAVMIFQPSYPRQGTKKLGRLYAGPYLVSHLLPGGKTLKVYSRETGEEKLCHIDNVKAFEINDYHPHPVPEPPIPQPSPEDQQRAVDHLTRAIKSAAHVLGNARARATISHVLGPVELPPLPMLPRAQALQMPQPMPRQPAQLPAMAQGQAPAMPAPMAMDQQEGQALHLPAIQLPSPSSPPRRRQRLMPRAQDQDQEQRQALPAIRTRSGRVVSPRQEGDYTYF